MKKTILIAAVAVASMVSFGAMAQNQKCDVKCDSHACSKVMKCEKSQARPCPNPFDGLNLSAEQQDKLKALKPCPADKKEARKEERRRQRQQKDSLAQVAHEKYLADVKSVLTPEQYVQFLENIAKQARPDKMKKFKGDKKGKGKRQPNASKNQLPQ